MMIGKVEIDGKKYKLQHPGAYLYYGKKKELQLIDLRGYVQWDTQKLFDFCFGQDAQGGQVVFPLDDNVTKIKWREAGLVKSGIDGGELIPTLAELQGVWAVILPSFLNGDFEGADGDDKRDWRWYETAGGNPKGNRIKVLDKIEEPESETTEEEK